MARPRTPTSLLELRGAFKEHPERKAERANEPRPTEPLGKPPSGMTAAQKKVWKELASLVVPGVLTISDRIAVELAVVLTSRLRDGSIKTQEISILTTLLGKLGMTPSDRAKVSAVPQPKETSNEDSWSDFVTPIDAAR